MMCTTSMPRLSTNPRMNSGMSSPAIRSGRTQTSSAWGSTRCTQRFGERCVVIKDGAKRARSIPANQSIVPLSDPPRPIHGAR